jgi:hypothetical protein
LSVVRKKAPPRLTAFVRSMEAFTVSASSVDTSWNFTLGRSLSSIHVPSGATFHDCASAGPSSVVFPRYSSRPS